MPRNPAVSGYEPEGRGFNSCQPHHKTWTPLEIERFLRAFSFLEVTQGIFAANARHAKLWCCFAQLGKQVCNSGELLFPVHLLPVHFVCRDKDALKCALAQIPLGWKVAAQLVHFWACRFWLQQSPHFRHNDIMRNGWARVISWFLHFCTKPSVIAISSFLGLKFRDHRW